MRLIFMGTPEAAVPTLRRCLEDGHEVAAVWTQPDRPAGRGHKLKAPPVKEFAQLQGLTIQQPTKIRNEEALALFASHRADAAIVVAYGRILPPGFLRATRRGCINVHFSRLPKYRGAAPVNWAIVRGETDTGVTTMQMDEGLDTGPILLQQGAPIGPQETAPELMLRLSLAGADLLGETLQRLDRIEPRAQRDQEATFAPVLKREDGLVNWAHSAIEIERRVRGFQPWPNAYTKYAAGRLALWRASAENADKNPSEPGTVLEARGDNLSIACGRETVLHLHEVQPEGKRRMSVRDFLNGTRLPEGSRLG
jgi:methionyl-tRNA formyltransferase